MKKKIAICLLAGVVSTSLLSGCDLKDLRALMPGGVQVSEEQEEQTEKSEIETYEEKIASGEASETDYMALANLYAGENRVREQRDTLEQCWRLFSSEDSFTQLQQLTVNAEEESEEIRSEFQRLADNLVTEENLNESVAMLVAPEWFPMVMPKLKEGNRNYYWKTEGGDTLFVQAGYTSGGQAFSKVWYTGSENQLTFLHYEAGMVQSVKTMLENGVCTGSFDSWVCDSASGSTLHETGTFQDGVCVGAYNAQAAFKDANSDPFAFWQGREQLDLTTYTGDFGTDGVTTVDQPKTDKKIVAYAYNEKKTNYLYISTEEDAKKAVFRSEMFGVSACPEFQEYDAPESESTIEGFAGTVEAGDIKVRIYDNEIQWYDGASWHSAGSVSSYQAQDPFAEYNAKPAQTEGNDGKDSASPAASRIGNGKVEAEKPKASSSSGSSSSGSKSSGSSGSSSGGSTKTKPKKTSPDSSGGGSSSSGDGQDITYDPNGWVNAPGYAGE